MFDDDGACSPTASYACIDPDAPCVNDDSVTVDMIDLCEAQDIGEAKQTRRFSRHRKKRFRNR